MRQYLNCISGEAAKDAIMLSRSSGNLVTTSLAKARLSAVTSATSISLIAAQMLASSADFRLEALRAVSRYSKAATVDVERKELRASL